VKPGIVVTGLTASALAAVTVLALQAQGSARTLAGPHPQAPAPKSSAPASAGGSPTSPPPVPTDSGTGKRAVYSLTQKRVWIVPEGAATAQRTFTVQPSAVSPLVGTYSVTSERKRPHTGSDGTVIEYGVNFASNGGVTIGFSAAVDGSMASPKPGLRTGGIRESVADGQALYTFLNIGDKVVVVQ
jgi:hypothetical protein